MAIFAAQESQLVGLRKTVEEICRQASLPPKEINNIILAIEEGASNIIRHSYMLGEGEIRLKVGIFKHFIIFSLFDTGKSFQPPNKSRIDLKKMSQTGRKGGLGFYLLNKVMDRVDYFSLEGENELRMTKFISDKGEKELQWSGGISLRVKFSAWTLLIVLILVTGAYFYINTRSADFIQSRLEKTVSALCNTTASQAYGYIINQRSDVEFDELVVSYQRANDLLISIIIVDEKGAILADSEDPSQLRRIYKGSVSDRILTSSPYDVLESEDGNPVIIRRIKLGETYLGAVIMEYSSSAMEWELERSRKVILIITGIGLLIGITGVYLLSNHFVKPIGRIVRRVRRFSEGDLDSQLPLTGAEEFYEISRALNELIMRIRRDHKNIIEREILQKEMQVAEQIQKALIPSQWPTFHGYDIGTIYKAARMVGGDLFDFVRIDDNRFGVVVADVSGKGVPGSLVMSMVRTALRLEARGNKSARDILVKLNDFITGDIRRGMFVTIMLAVIDIRSGNINFASAGHNPLIHYDSKNKKASFVNAPGMPVGIQTGNNDFEKALKSAQIKLRENDFLLIYTDGITEERGRDKSAYGTDRILEILKENDQKSAGDLADLIKADIARFVGEQEHHDDITMVILKNCPRTRKKEHDLSEQSQPAASDHTADRNIDSVTINPQDTNKKNN